MNRFRILWLLGLVFGLFLSCSSSDTTSTDSLFVSPTACTDDNDCSHSKTCQNGRCHFHTSTNCKHSSICGSEQACINKVCSTNVCGLDIGGQDLDCTDPQQTCQSGTCKTQTIAVCKTDTPCTANGNSNNKACVHGKCGCNSNADCSGATIFCNAGLCVKPQCTQNSDCHMYYGQYCNLETGTCTTMPCSGLEDTGCPEKAVCNGEFCMVQTPTHCYDATVCPSGQTCSIVAPSTTPSCTNKSCTKTADCSVFPGTNCIAGVCVVNHCKNIDIGSGTGAGNCTDSNETCQSGSCRAQTSSNCRSGYTCPTPGDTCATGKCTCSASATGCTTGDICISGFCQAETATNCIPGGNFCDTSVLKGTTCNAVGVCVCGTVAGYVTCLPGQTCEVTDAGIGICSYPPRYAFITYHGYKPGIGFIGLSGANVVCNTEFQSTNPSAPEASTKFSAVLGISTQSMYTTVRAFALAPRYVVDYVTGNPISYSGLPPTPNSTCADSIPGFDCAQSWIQQPTQIFSNSSQNQTYWTGSGYDSLNGFFEVTSNPDNYTCRDWSYSQNSAFGTGGESIAYYGQSKWYTFAMSCNSTNSLFCLETD